MLFQRASPRYTVNGTLTAVLSNGRRIEHYFRPPGEAQGIACQLPARQLGSHDPHQCSEPSPKTIEKTRRTVRETELNVSMRPTSSPEMLVPAEASTLLARFEEWPPKGVKFAESGKTVVQLQLNMDPLSKTAAWQYASV